MSAERVALCRADELAHGEMRRVEREGGPPLAVYNVDGELHATDDTCTHARASLSEGELDGDEVICPVHMGTFSVRTGEALCFPAKTPLRVHRVVVEDGVAYAEVDDRTPAGVAAGDQRDETQGGTA